MWSHTWNGGENIKPNFFKFWPFILLKYELERPQLKSLSNQLLLQDTDFTGKVETTSLTAGSKA